MFILINQEKDLNGSATEPIPVNLKTVLNIVVKIVFVNIKEQRVFVKRQKIRGIYRVVFY